MKRFLPTFTALLLGGALAQAASPLRLLLTQQLVTVVTENGKAVEKLIPAPQSVRPGDTLTQHLTASNVGASVLKDAALTVPVPQGFVYVGNVTPANPRWITQFSFDRGKTFGTAPLMKTIAVTENGKTVYKDVVVSPSEYTNVRWVVALIQPDETLKLGFRVKVK